MTQGLADARPLGLRHIPACITTSRFSRSADTTLIIETFEERPESYHRLVSLNPEGRIYLAGDYLSYWPGWQEGALGAANWVYKMIRERVRQ